MIQNKLNLKSSFEAKCLLVLTLVFVGAIAGGWFYAMSLKQTVANSSAVAVVDQSALVEIERLRNAVESQIASGRSYFLLGSRSLLEKQKYDRDTYVNGLANFEKQRSLPEIPTIVKKLEALQTQQDEIFEQAIKYRDKQTDSKIVGQFYQAKIFPLRALINGHLDEIVKIHHAEVERARNKAQAAALEAQYQIPRGMAFFTVIMAVLFFSVAALVLSALRERTRQILDRNRLYEEAKLAILSRDEVISAVASDFKEPVAAIYEVARTATVDNVIETREMLKAIASDIDVAIKNIYDQKTADMGLLTLRVDQISIDEALEEARMKFEYLAKKNDIRLQFESVNPPVLAFFDKERIMRVLYELIGNAVKFSPKHSKVIVKVRSDQQFVNISVVDSGPGLPDKQQLEIFEHFWQARKTADLGAGTGLAIVKTLVEAHGGSVKVAAHAGAGSTFTFSLPRRRPVGANIRRPKAPIVRQASKPSNIEFKDVPRSL